MGSRFQQLSPDGVFLDVRGEMARRRGPVGHLAHHVGRIMTSPWAFALLLLVGVVWAVVNSGGFAAVEPWDPYPFPLLGTIYSVLGPLVSVLILMRQFRDQQVTELTNELELQTLLSNDRKLTVVLQLLDAQRRGLAPDVDSKMLDALLNEIDHGKLAENMRQRLERDERRG